MKIAIEKDADGRWLAEIPALPGVMVCASRRAEAIAKAEALAPRALADRLEHGEDIPDLRQLFVLPA